jgi:uncharacterized repeat protein (TIGR04076 family)
MEVSEEVWKYVQKLLGYTDLEMKKLRQNPRNQELVSRAPSLMNTRIILEVVDSHGCNKQHKVGDKFYFDGGGGLLTRLCPEKVCLLALAAVSPLVQTAIEQLYADVDPNKMMFRRFGCPDVGLECDGWGHIVMELHVEKQNKQ